MMKRDRGSSLLNLYIMETTLAAINIYSDNSEVTRRAHSAKTGCFLWLSQDHRALRRTFWRIKCPLSFLPWKICLRRKMFWKWSDRRRTHEHNLATFWLSEKRVDNRDFRKKKSMAWLCEDYDFGKKNRKVNDVEQEGGISSWFYIAYQQH